MCCALLDTDFISKTYKICDGMGNKLITRILGMNSYEFYCHEQIKVELSRQDDRDMYDWFLDQLESGNIVCYGDADILSILEAEYGTDAQAIYIKDLHNACILLGKNYSDADFKSLKSSEEQDLSSAEFLDLLNRVSQKVGIDSDFGEIKTKVLMETLGLKHKNMFYFCSDDKTAREALYRDIDDKEDSNLYIVQCVSVLTSFIRLYKEENFGRDEAEPYIQSYISYLKQHRQVNFKVHKNNRGMSLMKVPCLQVFDEIYSGKLVELPTGDLMYH